MSRTSWYLLGIRYLESFFIDDTVRLSWVLGLTDIKATSPRSKQGNIVKALLPGNFSFNVIRLGQITVVKKKVLVEHSRIHCTLYRRKKRDHRLRAVCFKKSSRGSIGPRLESQTPPPELPTYHLRRFKPCLPTLTFLSSSTREHHKSSKKEKHRGSRVKEISLTHVKIKPALEHSAEIKYKRGKIIYSQNAATEFSIFKFTTTHTPLNAPRVIHTTFIRTLCSHVPRLNPLQLCRLQPKALPQFLLQRYSPSICNRRLQKLCL